MSILIHKATFHVVRMLIFFCGLYTFSQQDYAAVKTLNNGFSYCIQKNEHPPQTTLFYLVVKTGSINENNDQLGYAHFLEHMAFKGGKRFKDKPFTQYLKEQGLQIGTHYNAITKYDYTIYTIESPKKTTFEIQQKVMAFFADVVNGLTLEQKDIETEKRIVLEEKRISEPITKHYNSKLGTSLYAKRLAIGTKNSIHGISHKRLNAFYKKWYQPKNAAVFVVGNFNGNQMEDIIKNTFSSIKNNTSTNTNTNNQIYKYLNTAVTTKTNTNNAAIKVHLEWASKHILTTPEETLRKKIVYSLFVKALQKRINGLLKNEIDYFSMHTNYFLSDVDYTSISFTAKSDVKRSIKKILEEIRRLSLHDISKKELRFYIKDAIKNIADTNHKPKPSHTIINTLVNAYLGVEFAISPIQKNRLKHDILQEITPEDIKETAKNFIRSDKLRVFIEQPSVKKSNLSLQELKAIKKEVLNKNLKPVFFDVPKREVKNNSVFELSAPVLRQENPIQKKYFKKLGVTKLRYKNGVEVYLKPLQNKSNEIVVSGMATGGTSAIPDSLYYQYEFAVSYMELGGIANLNSNQLEIYHEDKDFGLSLTISEFERNIYGHTKTHQLNEFLKYMYLKMTAAKADTAEFNSVIKEEIASLKSQNQPVFKPDSYKRKVAELKNAYFPQRKRATTPKDYQNLDIFKIKEFYDSAFNTANGWKFIITGEFSVTDILPIINTYFGNLKNTETLKNKELFNRNSAANQVKVPLGVNEKTASTTFLFYEVYEPTVKNSILVSLAEKYLFHKITNALREKHGLVYTPVISIEKNIHPKPFTILQIQYDCKPENTQKAKDIVIRTLKRIHREKIAEQELSAYKKGTLLQYHSILTGSNNYSWNSVLLKSVSNSEYLRELENFSGILNKITISDFEDFIAKTINFKKAKIIYKD